MRRFFLRSRDPAPSPGRGHRVLAGTPEQIADDLELWFTKGAADGFNIMPPTYPGGLEVFVDTVVPALRRGDPHREHRRGLP